MYDLRNKKHSLVYANEVHKMEFCLYISHSIVRLKHNEGNGNVDLLDLRSGKDLPFSCAWRRKAEIKK